MPGMRKSLTNKSGGSSTARSNASAESVVVLTIASGVNASRSMRRTIGLSSTSSSFTLFAMRPNAYPIATKVATLSAGFPLEHNLAYLNAFIQGLAHIVHGQSGDTCCHQGFHLDTRHGR